MLLVKMDCTESGMSGCSQESGKAQSNIFVSTPPFLRFILRKIFILLPGCWASLLCSAPLWGQGCSLCFSRRVSTSPFRSQGRCVDPLQCPQRGGWPSQLQFLCPGLGSVTSRPGPAGRFPSNAGDLDHNRRKSLKLNCSK